MYIATKVSQSSKRVAEISKTSELYIIKYNVENSHLCAQRDIIIHPHSWSVGSKMIDGVYSIPLSATTVLSSVTLHTYRGQFD